MSDSTIVALIWIGLALIVGLLFPPTRAVLKWLFAVLWSLLEWAAKLVFTQAQALAVRVWRAHMTILANLLPRRAVIPSVGEEGTRKD